VRRNLITPTLLHFPSFSPSFQLLVYISHPNFIITNSFRFQPLLCGFLRRVLRQVQFPLMLLHIFPCLGCAALFSSSVTLNSIFTSVCVILSQAWMVSRGCFCRGDFAILTICRRSFSNNKKNDFYQLTVLSTQNYKSALSFMEHAFLSNRGSSQNTTNLSPNWILAPQEFAHIHFRQSGYFQCWPVRRSLNRGKQ